MTTTARRLEYTVDEQGSVGTRGTYVEITEREWAQAREFASRRYRPYDAVLQALGANKIVKLPCRTRHVALGVRHTLRKRARGAHMVIDDKVALLSTDPEEWAVLARRVEP